MTMEAESSMVPLPQTPRMAITLFGTDDPAEVVARAGRIAESLTGVIRKQRLTANIRGREYVRVEGWTLLGSMLGVFPVLAWTRPTEKGWEARVEARTISGAIVGAAEAQCTRDETTWATRDDFALRSMAQTRATAKAMRLPLGFVVAMAGFEATPAEEMPTDRDEPESPFGICPDHNVAYFKSSKMRTAAHKIEGGGWCNKPDDTPPPPTPSLADQAAEVARARTPMPASAVPASKPMPKNAGEFASLAKEHGWSQMDTVKWARSVMSELVEKAVKDWTEDDYALLVRRFHEWTAQEASQAWDGMPPATAENTREA